MTQKKIRPQSLYKLTVTRGMIGRRITANETSKAPVLRFGANVRKINSLKVVPSKIK